MATDEEHKHNEENETGLSKVAELMLTDGQMPIKALVVLSYYDEDGASCLTLGNYGISEPSSDLGLLTWAQHIVFEQMDGNHG